MKKNALIITAALAAAGLGAGVAQAAPEVASVTVNRTGHHKLQVVVQALHGTSTDAPRVSATIGSRTRGARAMNWTSTAPAADPVTFVANFKHVRPAVGTSVVVTVDACDTTCTSVTRTVTVTKATAADRSGRNHPEDNPPAALPAGSVTSDQAVAAALASVGPGSTLIRVEREDHPGVAYEVKVRRADGMRVEVKIAADGTVVSSHVDK
jgi:hypothetical protein